MIKRIKIIKTIEINKIINLIKIFRIMIKKTLFPVWVAISDSINYLEKINF